MKRGQITVFIILAMIMAIAAALLIFLYEKQIIFQPEVIDPPMLDPISQYVESCIFDLSTDAIEKIGLQGGYLDVPDVILMEPQSFIDYGITPIPLWYYDGEMRIPSLDFIAQEIATYVEQNLQTCVGGFSAFSSRYNIYDEQPTVEVEYARDGVLVYANYPLTIEDRYDRAATDLEKFTVNVDVDLKSAWQVANATMNRQHETYIFENMTIDLMADFPFTGLEFQCSEPDWRVSQLKSKLQDVLQGNLPRIRIAGTDYPPFEREESFYEAYRQYTFEDTMERIYDEYEDGYFPEDAVFDYDISRSVSDWYEYFQLFFDVGANAPEQKVVFQYYSSWDMDFQVQPSEGDRLMPRSFPGAGILNFMCMQMYHYTYNIRYPVMVRILDPDAFMGKGFYFQFAFPVLIQENQGVHESFRSANFDWFRTSYDFCDDDLGTTIYTIQAKGMDDDGYPNQPLHGVNLSYQCVNRRCDDIGITAFQGKADVRLPEACANPTIRGKKVGYLDGTAVVTGSDVEIELEKLREFNYTVERYTYAGILSEREPLEYFENATFIITSLDGRHEQVLHYPPLDDQKLYLKMEGGEYKVEAILYRQGLDDIEIVGGYFKKNLTLGYSDFGTSEEAILPVILYTPQPTSIDEEGVMMRYLMKGEYDAGPIFI